MNVKVLGPGCQRCKKLYEETAKAIQQLGLTVDLAKVEAMDEILRYRILATPGLVIDGEVKSAGRIPSQQELASWLTTAVTKAGG
ncbi:MAG: TM0996/MTH895 family glutaredoxin-like protein [Deltaproteobacteria bacterium]|nr:TM0996/MTH895 family glutaredoxin-like protein [Deltaproteobacteria bacterium]